MQVWSSEPQLIGRCFYVREPRCRNGDGQRLANATAGELKANLAVRVHEITLSNPTSRKPVRLAESGGHFLFLKNEKTPTKTKQLLGYSILVASQLASAARGCCPFGFLTEASAGRHVTRRARSHWPAMWLTYITQRYCITSQTTADHCPCKRYQNKPTLIGFAKILTFNASVISLRMKIRRSTMSCST